MTHPKQIQLIEDEHEFRVLMNRAADSTVQASVKFMSLGDESYPSRLESFKPDKEISLRIPSGLPKKIEAIEPGECLVLAYLKGQLILGVQGHSWEVRDGLLWLPAPWRRFKIQRRKEARLEIPTGYDFFITIDAIEGPDRRVQKRLLDLSASGLAFQIISPREAALYRTGLMMKNIIVKVLNREIRIDAQVMNNVPHTISTLGKCSKVGLSFLRISPDDQKFITSYVTSQLAGPIMKRRE